MAAEATLQPMRRFGFDASIVFADILLLPKAIGQDVWFETGEGPRLGALPELAVLRSGIENVSAGLAPVSETLKRVRAGLGPDKTLLGFCGAPWTVATYMMEGRSSDRSASRLNAYREPQAVDELLDILVEASAIYLADQVAAGAQALQIFESWSEGLPPPAFERLVIKPQIKLINRLRSLGVTVPVIGFPRGASSLVETYADQVPVEAVSLDSQTPIALGARIQAGGKTIQGALDPLILLAGGDLLDREVDRMVEGWAAGPYIFNLGHGILPSTPMAHVDQVLGRLGAQ